VWALAKREKKVKYRRVIQLLFAAISNSYLTGFATGTLYKGNLKMVCNPGLNCYSCPGTVMSCPIGSLQAVIGSRAFSVSLYVFGLILMFGALMGRAVCGFLCPFGWVQELLHKIPFPVKRNRFKGDKQLRYLKYVVLLVFVLILPMTLNNEAGNAPPAFCKYICPAGTLEAGIPHVYFKGAPPPPAPSSGSGLVKSLNIVPTQSGPKVGALFTWKMALLAAVVLLSVAIYRPFCKYLCPLGAMYGIINPWALYRLRLDPSKCVACGACARACGMCIDPVKTTNHAECVRCGDCVNVCPTGALSLGVGHLKPEHAPMGSPGKEGTV